MARGVRPESRFQAIPATRKVTMTKATATPEGARAVSARPRLRREHIPDDSAAALILLEHHWAVPLRDAVFRAGGFRISDGFISPLDLVAIGLMSAEEAKEHHEMETSGAAGA